MALVNVVYPCGITTDVQLPWCTGLRLRMAVSLCTRCVTL